MPMETDFTKINQNIDHFIICDDFLPFGEVI